MLALGLTLATAIGILAVLQLLGVIAYLRHSQDYVTQPIAAKDQSEAAIILSLRGDDPYLADCLQCLSQLEYANYSLHIVVDHVADPARSRVEAWMNSHPERQIHLEFLEDISDEAYLKTNAVRQCIQKLSSSVQFAVLADADTLVYPHWLQDMIAPMTENKNVGVVTGNRWYDPTRKACGTLVRCIYNACSVVPMYFMRATWGGALSMSRDVFAQDYFYDHMRKTPSEDLAIQAAARFANKQVEVHPNVMIMNREECSLGSCFNFIRRQLIWTRLYHPNWNLIVFGVLAVYLLLSVAFFATLLAAYSHHWPAAFLMGGALLLQLVIAQFNLEWLHRTIAARMAEKIEEPFHVITWPARIRLLCVWPLAFVVLCWAVFSASLSRRVHWRGITYAIVPPNGIRMLEYRPYKNEQSPGVTDGVSLG